MKIFIVLFLVALWLIKLFKNVKNIFEQKEFINENLRDIRSCFSNIKKER